MLGVTVVPEILSGRRWVSGFLIGSSGRLDGRLIYRLILPLDAHRRRLNDEALSSHQLSRDKHFETRCGEAAARKNEVHRS